MILNKRAMGSWLSARLEVKKWVENQEVSGNCRKTCSLSDMFQRTAFWWLDELAYSNQSLFPHLPWPFFLPADVSSTRPALINASRATVLMSANLLGPSFWPPYHRVTTTIQSHKSISCIR